MRSLVVVAVACSGRPSAPKVEPVVIDRFSDAAGHLMKRSASPSLPGPDQPIDFDHPPFITQGLGPDGKPVRYYNFDVQPDVPAPLYRPMRGGKPIEGQPDLVDVLPGDPGYSDFWRVHFVRVEMDVGPLTSVAQLARFEASPSSTVIDCPIVPRGSKAATAIGVTPPQIRELGYRGHRVTCLEFSPSLITNDRVPTSPIYVTFKSEGRFESEPDRPVQTHNVVMSVPGDTDYSPLWAVHVYDRAAFDTVRDANTALAAPGVKKGPLVNCPIVAVGL